MTPEASYGFGRSVATVAWSDASRVAATVLAVSVHLGDDNESNPDSH